MFWNRKKTHADMDDADAARQATEAPSETSEEQNNIAVEAETDMNILRFLDPACIKMELTTTPTVAIPDETEAQRERRLIAEKESVIQELAELMDNSGQVVNPTKYYKDMLNRERKATTGIAPSIAIPHVRTLQCRSFVLGFARAPKGVHFASLDGTLTKIFLILSSPPYEDKMYLKVYRQFAELVSNEWIVEAMLEAENEQDILNILRGQITQ